MSRSTEGEKWIVLVGGGTGGHVVPIKNIAEEILKKEPSSKILIITDKGYKDRTGQIFEELMAKHSSKITLRHVSGGRFRRYSRSKLREALDIKTQLLNLRDLFKTLAGIIQSKFILLKFKPAVIFCKGGTGALEFCYAARNKAPIIVHDSDSRPGLANKTVGRWATVVLAGMPRSAKEAETYNKALVGVPVSSDFKPVSTTAAEDIRDSLGLDQKSKTVLITGGSLGAKKINEIIFCTISDLNRLGIQVLHQIGGGNDDIRRAKDLKKSLTTPNLYRPFDFTNEMSKFYGAADVIVSRAGASAIQEIANSGKPAILIPAGLTDQKKNGKILEDLGAALVADQSELLKRPEEFISEIQFLLDDKHRRDGLVERISILARPDTVHRIVDEILRLKNV